VAAPYKLTEEIARYHLEVVFQRTQDWEVCFTNPTAGPWKLIKVGGYIGGKELRYIKEEGRPDLILFCKEKGIFIIAEAKDSCAKFISSGVATVAMKKSIEVFEKETARIDKIVAAAGSLILGSGEGVEYKVAVAYLYPMSHGSPEPINQLTNLFLEHERLANGRDARLQNCVVFRVLQDSSYQLRSTAVVARRANKVSFGWVECLPMDVERIEHQIEA